MNPLDRLIAVFSPKTALARARARYALRAYEAASVGRRSSSWRAWSSGANAEIAAGLRPMRDRARDLVRNTPHAGRLIEIMVSNSVGDGLQPVSTTGSDSVDRKVADLWNDWKEHADIARVLTFDAMQALCVRAIVESGEVVIRFVDRKKTDTPARVPFQLQVLESDFIDESRDGIYQGAKGEGLTPETQRSRLGVGLGAFDAVTGLWLYPWHPGETTTYNMRPWTSRFYARDEALHVFRVLRPGQVRGVTWFAPIMTTSRDYADFVDAALVKARVEACFSGFITNSDDFEPVLDTTPGLGTTMPDPNNPQALISNLEPGLLKELKTGQDIKFAQPTSTSQVEQLMLIELMAMAAGANCTYDQMSGDLRQANYSSLRAGKLDFKQFVSKFQKHTLIAMMCQPIWNRFIETAILVGELRERKGGYPCQWVTPAWESVNPKFDQDAEERSVRAGRMSPQEFIASWGGDWRKMQDDHKAFFDRADELGVVFDIDPRKMTRAGLAQKPPAPVGTGAPGMNGSGGKPNGDGAGGGNGADHDGGSTGLFDTDGNEITSDDLQDMLDAAGGDADSPFSRALAAFFETRDFDESAHPRDPDGKFTNAGGGEDSAATPHDGVTNGSKAPAAAAAKNGSGKAISGSAGGDKGVGSGSGGEVAHEAPSHAYTVGSPASAQGSGALAGAQIKTDYTPTDATRDAFEKKGITPTSFHELGSGGAQVFHDAIQAAKDASPNGAAVHVYPVNEYAKMRTFITADGKAGFALHGNEIISVFRHPNAEGSKIAASMLALAIDEGGRRLDAFDTALPKIYGNAGFTTVARLPFDDKEKPAGWDVAHFAQYNGGRPDVVFMVYEGAKSKPYQPGDGDQVADYGAGLAAQDKALQEISEGKRDFDESEHPRDPDGKFTDKGGGDEGGKGPPRAPAAVAEPSGAKPGNKPAPAATPAPAAASTAAPPREPKQKELWPGKFPPIREGVKVEPADFAKDKVDLRGDIARDPEKAKKFVEVWEKKVGEAPAQFKNEFTGGLNTTMLIEHKYDDRQLDHDGEPITNAMEMRGYVLDDDGARIGEYTRTIDFADNTATSDYFKLNNRAQGKDTAKTMLAANVAMYQKLGLDVVKVHANIDVGGYAWAKYGYVPDTNSWRGLRSDIIANIDKLEGGGGGYTASSWDEMSDDMQRRAERSWMSESFSEFMDSEVENWRDSGGDLAQAKTELADHFDPGNVLGTKMQWAYDGLKGYSVTVGEGADLTAPSMIAFLNSKNTNIDSVLAATTVSYDDRRGDGTEDPTVTIEPSKTPELNDDERGQIEEIIAEVFNKEAESRAPDIDPPDMSDQVRDYQRDYWDQMEDTARFEYAERNGYTEGEGSGGGDTEIDHDTAEDLRALADSDDPKAVWAIADNEHGKELLLGTDWYGRLDLHDKETMDRFTAYVGKGKNAPPQPAAG